MNIFNDKILKYKLNLSTNGDDNTHQTIEKKIKDFKNEINRVKSLPYYHGEDNIIIQDIENIIRRKYTQYLLSIFFTMIRLKIKFIKFRKKYYCYDGKGYHKLLNNWYQYQ